MKQTNIKQIDKPETSKLQHPSNDELDFDMEITKGTDLGYSIEFVIDAILYNENK